MSNIQTSRDLTSLIERSKAFDAVKSDYLVESHKFYFNNDGALCIPGDFGTVALNPEDLALNQLAGRIGTTFWDQPRRTLPSDVFRQLNRSWPSHFASLTNDMLNRVDDKMLIRGYDDKARAILSDSYSTLDNTEILEMAAQVLEGTDYEIVESGKYYRDNGGLNRDEMALRIVVKYVKPPTDDSGYGLGVLIRNGETGGSASEIRPLVLRTSCMNSLVFRVGEDGERAGLRLTHRGLKDAKAVLLASALAEGLPMAAAGLRKFLETKEKAIDLNAVIAKLADDEGWSEDLRGLVAIGSEGHQSIFGLANGLTFGAHEAKISMSERFQLETLATQFVYNPNLVKA